MRGNRQLLIRGGYVLTMNDDLGDLPCGDVLIDGSQITDIAPTVAVADGWDGDVIDATGMLVTPGFIDNHRHMWQSLIRGVSANFTFGQYFAHSLEVLSGRYTPDDIYLGNLLSAYEALDAGTTTILDWSHALNTPAHAEAALRGLEDSGARAVLAYGPPSVEWWLSDGQPKDADVIRLADRIDRGGLVTLGLAIRGPEFSTMERVRSDLALARELGIIVTMHAGVPGFHHATPSAKLLADAGLLDADLTFVHCNAMTEADFAIIAQAGAHVSCSPEVEMQKGFGFAPLAAILAGGARPTVSVDVVTAIGGQLLTQVRFLLQTQRALDHQTAFEQTGAPLPELPITTRDVLPYVTTHPAASLRQDHRIGQLAPGHQADLVLIDTADLNVLLSEPSAALVQSVHPGNIDTVLVAGRIVKQHRRLVAADLDRLRRKARHAHHRIMHEG